MPIRAVTVYCSSSTHVAPTFLSAAEELGRAIASNRWTLVYGGNPVGSMAALANAARNAGGKVVGITPQIFVDKGIADEQADELIITATMRERKALLESRGDAFVALPGGIGTFEEIFEILCARFLDVHAKPIVMLNVAGYYAPLITMIDHGIEHRFIRPRVRELLFVADSVSDAIDHLRTHDGAAT